MTIDSLVLPVTECEVDRDLLTASRLPLAGKPTWRVREAVDAAHALAAAGAAITQGEVISAPGDGTPERVAWERWMGTDEDGSLPAWRRWDCRRQDGEGWTEFAARSAAHAASMIRRLTGEARGAGDAELRVDLAWVTEDETALYDLPRRHREWLNSDEQVGLFPRRATHRTGLAGRPAPGSYHGASATDVRQIPADARFAGVTARGRNVKELASRTRLDVLGFTGAGDRHLAPLAELGWVRSLHVGDGILTSIEPLAGLSALRVLSLDSQRKLKSLAPLAGLPLLRSVALRLSGATDLSSTAALTQVTSLEISTWPPVATLAPLAALTGLRDLSLFLTRVADGSLAPLHSLRGLRRLTLETDALPLAEYARLGAALPDVAGLERLPFAALPDEKREARCPTCGGADLAATAGKPRRILCRACDRDAIVRYVVEWEVLVSGIAPR